MRPVGACALWCLASVSGLGQAPPVSYRIGTIAGGEFSGDGGPASSALLLNVEGLAFDAAGNLYVADASAHRVRRIAPTGIITTVAGNGQRGFSGDGGSATAASLSNPYGLATDPTGNLYIADLGNSRVRHVSPDGRIRTVAGGTGQALKSPRNVAVAGDGALLISDYDGQRVYRLSRDGMLNAVPLAVSYPASLAFDREGFLYVADSGGRRVWRMSQDGRVVVVAGGVGTPIGAPTGLAFDRKGNLYIVDADRGSILRRTPDGEVATVLSQTGLRDVAVDAAGSLYAGGGARVIRAMESGGVQLVAGGVEAAQAQGSEAALRTRLSTPIGITLDEAGNLYVAEETARRVRRITPQGIAEVVLGSVLLRDPVAVAVNPLGLLAVADFAAHRIVGLSPSGVVTALAGTGVPGHSGDGQAATAARLNKPRGLAFDRNGNLFFADSGNHCIRRVSPNGVITTVAGDGKAGFAGDGGKATLAQLNNPVAVAFDASGRLLIADAGNNAIRLVTAEGLIHTMESATGLRFPASLAADRNGDVFVADTYNHRVVRIDPGGGVTTVAGDGTAGFSGDGEPADKARLNTPASVAIDAQGQIYVADLENGRIRRLTPQATLASVPAVPVDAPSAVSELEILHAATLRPGPIAPGQLLVLQCNVAGPYVALIDGKPVLVLSAVGGRLMVQAPTSLAGEAEVELQPKGQAIVRRRATVVDAAPAFFTLSGGTGPVAAVLASGSAVTESDPAPRGALVTLYATGQGVDHAPRVEIGSIEAEIVWAGPSPGYPGVLQLNVRIPGAFFPPGVWPITLRAGGASSPPGVTISLQ
jgi:uncharacterized protein (TIGR03437 family)